jgi:hypothetical protein
MASGRADHALKGKILGCVRRASMTPTAVPYLAAWRIAPKLVTMQRAIPAMGPAKQEPAAKVLL